VLSGTEVPILRAENRQPMRGKGVINLELSPAILQDAAKRGQLVRMLLAALYGIKIVEDHEGWKLTLFKQDYSGAPAWEELNTQRLNELLAALPAEPVLRAVWSSKPMTFLVACSFRPVGVHMDHLLRSVDGVEHVCLAHEQVYDGRVLELFIPGERQANARATLVTQIYDALALTL
jgi:hypothetical protein